MILAATTPIKAPPIEWLAVAPEIALTAAGLIVILLTSIVRRRGQWVHGAALATAFVGVAVAAGFVAAQWQQVRDDGPYEAVAKMVAIDGFGVFLSVVVLAATALALLLVGGYLRREGLDGPELLALMLFSATGMLTMTTANDLITVFVALELLSIPLYVLAAFDRRRAASLEAGMKYFVLGAFSSAVFLYGVALVYGGTGTTSLSGIATFLRQNALLDSGTLLAGLALLLVGLGFKIAAVPFHMWTPDVYQGAPTPVTGFMASATKAAGFAAILRVLLTAFDTYSADWRPAIFALAVLSLVVGSVAALVQTDVKRMLAYSSITHAGYVLIGVQAASTQGVEAALFYLLVYTFMVAGSFGVVMVLARRGDRDHSLDGYRGVAMRHPVLAGTLALFMLAQAGVPLTGGFVAKLEVFSAGVQQHSYALVIVGVLSAVVAAFFYLRVIVVMYMSDEVAEQAERPVRVDAGTAIALAVAVAVTLFVGFLPGAFLHFARDATLLF